jgi:uncharacterized protein (TIGR02246 family)
MMKLLALALFAAALPAAAAVSEEELMQAAVGLARHYDANYAAKDAAGMAQLYAEDGILVSPSGRIIHGRKELLPYYVNRFASGAHDHHLAISEVHVQGDGGFTVGSFSVLSPDAGGKMREVHGNIVTVYQRYPDGWHIRLVEPSIPEQ